MDIDTFSRSSQQFILVADDYILSSKFNSVHNFLKYQIYPFFNNLHIFYISTLFSLWTLLDIIHDNLSPYHKISRHKDHSPLSFLFLKPQEKRRKKKGKSRGRLRSDIIDRGASHSKAIPEWRFLSLCSFRSFQLRNQHGDAY